MAAAKRKTVKKAPKELILESYFEVNGQQVSLDPNAITEKIKEAYKADGHRVSNIRKLQVYYNLPERKAYYVINDKPEDKFVEF